MLCSVYNVITTGQPSIIVDLLLVSSISPVYPFIVIFPSGVSNTSLERRTSFNNLKCKQLCNLDDKYSKRVKFDFALLCSYRKYFTEKCYICILYEISEYIYVSNTLYSCVHVSGDASFRNSLHAFISLCMYIINTAIISDQRVIFPCSYSSYLP